MLLGVARCCLLLLGCGSSRNILILLPHELHQLRPNTIDLTVNVPVPDLCVVVFLAVSEADLLAGVDASHQVSLIALNPVSGSGEAATSHQSQHPRVS